MKMKRTIKLLGMVIASIALVACGGGGSDPVKTEKVWKLVERSATAKSKRVVYKYNGSGLLERQVFIFEHFEFIYNDQGVLLKKEAYNAAEGGELVKYEEFDEYGEATRRLEKENGTGAFKETIVYSNKYPDDLDINNKETQKEIQQYVQRKILITWLHNELSPYLGSKIISRKREVTHKQIEVFDFTKSNEMITKVFEYPDDGVADKVFHAFYDKYGIRLFRREYDYEEENGNLTKATLKGASFHTHYTWKQMDIPVK